LVITLNYYENIHYDRLFPVIVKTAIQTARMKL